MTDSCARCSSPLDEGSILCAHCGAAVATDLGVVEAAPAYVPTFLPANDLEGIGGWLILPAIGLALTPFICLGPIFTDIQLLTAGDHQSLFANHPSLTALLDSEVVINLAFLAATICLNILFYTKKRILPKCMVAFYSAQCVLLLVDHLAATAIFPSVDLSSGLITVIRSFVVAAVWIPYFLNSQRVEQTFVN
jgi:hypothetical protein